MADDFRLTPPPLKRRLQGIDSGTAPAAATMRRRCGPLAGSRADRPAVCRIGPEPLLAGRTDPADDIGRALAAIHGSFIASLHRFSLGVRQGFGPSI